MCQCISADNWHHPASYLYNNALYIEEIRHRLVYNICSIYMSIPTTSKELMFIHHNCQTCSNIVTSTVGRSVVLTHCHTCASFVQTLSRLPKHCHTCTWIVSSTVIRLAVFKQCSCVSTFTTWLFMNLCQRQNISFVCTSKKITVKNTKI